MGASLERVRYTPAHEQVRMLVTAGVRRAPIVIAHRGSSGERPEHTLASYQRAIDQGADYIEPDLVVTRDGVLVARHENEISETTDVASRPAFETRRRTQLIDGVTVTGWFTEDFTLEELKTLRAVERLPGLRPANRAYDGRFEVPTFEEIMRLATEVNRRRDPALRIGVYPETKHPEHFAALGLPEEQRLLDVLSRFGYAGAGSPVYLQSFDPSNLRELRSMTPLPLVQLLEHRLIDLDRVAEYADAIGIAKSLATAETIAAAHARGLAVHVWTFRAENEFLPMELRRGTEPEAHGDLAGEILRYLERGIDGYFTDFPAIGVEVREAWMRRIS
ncbi:MAG TPA: glycerophosphodiester phosphodiesterase family protein [Steroidobacteraceae bacterium]|nr:glycerophosphodiester phosphodiesterase family protein [Steroidobacteraceae bacterium]